MPEDCRKQVLLIIETSNKYARGLLLGIRKYIREHRSWAIHLGEYSRNHIEDAWLQDWRGDGIIARIENERIARHVLKTGVPIVDVSASRLLPDLPYVETNDANIAKLAVEHLMERGFKTFAYVGDSSFAWSRLRRTHFEALVKQAGYPCRVYDVMNRESSLTGPDEQSRMAEWIRAVPKPVGVMSCYDILGQRFLEACRQANVRVPDEAAVIGVDNDELFCELSDPPLTSIATNPVKTGYLAAELLDMWMAGQRPQASTYLVEPLSVAARQSTDTSAVADRQLIHALRCIEKQACSGMNVNDLLRQVPLSRRTLETRFKKAFGRTPHEEILAVKLRFVKQLLLETDLPLVEIAERAGFKNTEYLNVVFKREVGATPGSYRSQNRLDY